MKKKLKREAYTSEEIEIAQRMWRDGKTYTQIGEKLGRTNNSVSGLMGRNRDRFPERFGDLMKKNKPSTISGKPKRSNRAAALQRELTLPAIEAARSALTANGLRQAFHAAFVRPTPPKPSHEYDESRLPFAVAMMDLDTKRCCTWAVTEYPKGIDNLFCGEVKAGKNYCENHAQRSVRLL